MAVLDYDGMDYYTTIGDQWDSVSGATINTSSGRRGGGCVIMTSSQAAAGRNVSPTTTDECIVGFAANYSSTSASDNCVWFAIREGSTNHVTLGYVAATGKVSVCLGGTPGSQTLGTNIGTSTTTFPSGSYTHFVLKVKIHDTAGTVDLWMNGNLEISLTGVATRNGGTGVYDNIRWSRGSNAFNQLNNLKIDDIYCLDTSGSAPWNASLGDVMCLAHYPTAEGNTIDWDPSTGSDNSALVDETSPNDDTDYNSSSALNDKDTFTTQDLSASGQIFAVQVHVRAKKTATGTGKVATVVRHSGTDYVGTDKTPTTSYTYSTQIYSTNPGTSAQWLEADFNAAEFGYKKTE